MDTADPELARQLAHALTGEWLPVARPEPRALIADLAAQGWDANALGELRRRCQGSGEPWPVPADAEALRRLGFAVFHARLSELRKELGLDGLRRVASADRPWTQEERRLAVDRPPHWG